MAWRHACGLGKVLVWKKGEGVHSLIGILCSSHAKSWQSHRITVSFTAPWLHTVYPLFDSLSPLSACEFSHLSRIQLQSHLINQPFLTNPHGISHPFTKTPQYLYICVCWNHIYHSVFWLAYCEHFVLLICV